MAAIFQLLFKQKVVDIPNAAREAGCHGRCHTQATVYATEIIVCKVQGCRGHQAVMRARATMSFRTPKRRTIGRVFGRLKGYGKLRREALPGETLFEGGEGFEGAGHGADHGPKCVLAVPMWSPAF